MLKLNKQLIILIDPQFTWKNWQLYSLPASINAAKELNAQLKLYVNAGFDRDRTTKVMRQLMQDPAFAECGAADPEALSFLQCVIEEIYR